MIYSRVLPDNLPTTTDFTSNLPNIPQTVQNGIDEAEIIAEDGYNNGVEVMNQLVNNAGTSLQNGYEQGRQGLQNAEEILSQLTEGIYQTVENGMVNGVENINGQTNNSRTALENIYQQGGQVLQNIGDETVQVAQNMISSTAVEKGLNDGLIWAANRIDNAAQIEADTNDSIEKDLGYLFSGLYSHLSNIGSQLWSSWYSLENPNNQIQSNGTPSLNSMVSPQVSSLGDERSIVSYSSVSQGNSFEVNTFLQSSMNYYQANLSDMKSFIQNLALVPPGEQMQLLKEIYSMSPPQLQTVHDLFAPINKQISSLAEQGVTLQDVDIAKEYLNGAWQALQQSNIHEQGQGAINTSISYISQAAQYLRDSSIGQVLSYSANGDNALLPFVLNLTRNILDNIQLKFYFSMGTPISSSNTPQT